MSDHVAYPYAKAALAKRALEVYAGDKSRKSLYDVPPTQGNPWDQPLGVAKSTVKDLFAAAREPQLWGFLDLMHHLLGKPRAPRRVVLPRDGGSRRDQLSAKIGGLYRESTYHGKEADSYARICMNLAADYFSLHKVVIELSEEEIENHEEALVQFGTERNQVLQDTMDLPVSNNSSLDMSDDESGKRGACRP